MAYTLSATLHLTGPKWIAYMNHITETPLHPSHAWGRYFNYQHRPVRLADRHSDIPSTPTCFLPYGNGRSYGDSCLNDAGYLVETRSLNHFIEFDTERGIIRCEAGVTLAMLHEISIPKGWFVAVTPGTKYVTVGGAVANDVHGKNHWNAGTFGCHVREFELLRSDQERLLCSPTSNPELFAATIGGLGLTGIITWVELQLHPVHNGYIDTENFQCGSLEHCLHLFETSRDAYEYRVAWIDCLASGNALGRSIFTRGNLNTKLPNEPLSTPSQWYVPFSFPHGVLNGLSVKAFNALYYRKLMQPRTNGPCRYDSFHYPLDSLLHWNKIYGPRGFLQYQCVLVDEPEQGLRELLNVISAAGQASFLSVLKELGPIRSPGLLSFPRQGYTLALDFPNRGKSTLQLLDKLDAIVKSSRGALYPAKDARMSSAMFTSAYANIDAFTAHIDPKISSNFWRRVT